MSGGALDYFYVRLQEIAEKIAPTPPSEYEVILGALLRDLAKVMRELEWYLSGDSDYEDFQKSFEEFAEKWQSKLMEIKEE